MGSVALLSYLQEEGNMGIYILAAFRLNPIIERLRKLSQPKGKSGASNTYTIAAHILSEPVNLLTSNYISNGLLFELHGEGGNYCVERGFMWATTFLS